MHFKDKSINDFIDELSSSSPVPGGGGAAAVSASLSTALSNMVFNLTVNKKAFASVSENEKDTVFAAMEYCKKKTEDFLSFIDKDGEAFSSLMLAYKLPKDTEENLTIRQEQIQSGLQNAMLVPLNLAKELVAVMEHIKTAAMYGNTNVISDAGVSAILAYASIESSILNVMVNLKFIESDDTNQIKEDCSNLLKKAEELKKVIMTLVYEKL
ncbi:cyclodeaminase/cyclohydrolase family protein [Clostridium folliculivorans]|uniref:Formiminotransferase-cyclodeaminase n=1 Tax=Clostridium folliculivorans TaxID=2886038 RepID=A0A9W5XZR1_9CLOT|nr:cyclodeaminase/cyclohydrolase family protein [Clostridium folliculivorans]GKU23948.1 formiminotransferase-cyclodeaminase [Clostridium folliculivorans]GKU30063.1 formiminotransferase-cyclodeaminase [Clostridium folliculivorans]